MGSDVLQAHDTSIEQQGHQRVCCGFEQFRKFANSSPGLFCPQTSWINKVVNPRHAKKTKQKLQTGLGNNCTNVHTLMSLVIVQFGIIIQGGNNPYSFSR